MSTTDRAFNQVKAILGKLDDSIDEARRRRLDEDEPKASAEPVSGHRKFGRAQPLRPSSERTDPDRTDRPARPGRATPLNRWE